MISFRTDLALTCVWVMFKKKKKLWRGVIQALSDVECWQFACACIWADGMRYALHECVWRMQPDLLTCIFVRSHKRPLWVRHLWHRFSTLWYVTRSESDLLRMPLKPNMFVLHDWQTWLLQICCMTKRQPTFKTFCTCWRWTVFPLFPLFFLSVSSLFSWLTFFLRCFHIFYFAAFSEHLCFFYEEMRPHSQLYQPLFW